MKRHHLVSVGRFQLVVAAAAIAVGALSGCNQSETGGVAGTNTFKLASSLLDTNVKQGEVATVRVWLERGAGFKQGVALSTKGGNGLTSELSLGKLGADEKGEVQLKVTAASDAPLGKQVIVVRATPDRGEAVELQIKVNIAGR